MWHLISGKRTGSHLTLWNTPELKIAGVTFLSPLVDNQVRPILLTADTPEVTIPINQTFSILHILGQVSLPVGYPLSGDEGNIVASYSLKYSNGKTQTILVRNGIEVAQSNCIFEATRINPIATAAQPVAEYIKDIVRERYQLLLWSVPVESQKIAHLRCILNGQQSPLALFALTTEKIAAGSHT